MATLRPRPELVELAALDARFAKPLDEELLARHANRYRQPVTLEERQRAAGLGSAAPESWSRLPAAIQPAPEGRSPS